MGKLEKMAARHGGAVEDSTGPGEGPSPRPAAPAGGPAKRPARLEGVAKSKDAAVIAVDRIVPDPDQPRKEFDPEELRLLGESLAAEGQLQPIRVWWDEASGMNVIEDGERRWRAAKLAGLGTLDAMIEAKALTPGERLRRQMVANCVRVDLNDVEKAATMGRLMASEGWSKGQLAAELKMTNSAVSKVLSLLKLDEGVRELVKEGKLAPHTAYELSGETPEVQREVAGKVVEGKLSRSKAVAEVGKARAAKGRAPKGKGRGGAKGKAPAATSWVVNGSGHRVTVERGSGIKGPGVISALEVALGRAREEFRAAEA